MDNVLRVSFPEKIPFVFRLKITSDYENYIHINPAYHVILPGAMETNSFTVGVSRSYNLKKVKIRA